MKLYREGFVYRSTTGNDRLTMINNVFVGLSKTGGFHTQICISVSGKEVNEY